jgi:hypothetical protein
MGRPSGVVRGVALRAPHELDLLGVNGREIRNRRSSHPGELGMMPAPLGELGRSHPDAPCVDRRLARQ